MPRLFRVLLLPVLLALPMVAASLEPLRFFRDPRCLTFFALMVIGLAIENALVDAGSVQQSMSEGQRKWDRRKRNAAKCVIIPPGVERRTYHIDAWSYIIYTGGYSPGCDDYIRPTRYEVLEVAAKGAVVGRHGRDSSTHDTTSSNERTCS